MNRVYYRLHNSLFRIFLQRERIAARVCGFRVLSAFFFFFVVVSSALPLAQHSLRR